MDFIEQLFGVSPDGGSGFLEIILFLIPVAGAALAGLRRRYAAKVLDRRGRRLTQPPFDVV